MKNDISNRILLEDSVAVMIDIQTKLAPLINDEASIIECATILLQAFDEINLPFLYCEQYPKGLGETSATLKPFLKECIKFEKTSFSAFGDEKIAAHIKSLNKKNVILFGMESHVCVLQTALDLLDANYRPVIVVDATGSRHQQDHEMALLRAQQVGCSLVTTESILFEFLRNSKHDSFKKISNLIK